jgi:sterol desaturase/sphingolipid hydroxylase (fatty acid hydroxylase superfamily)
MYWSLFINSFKDYARYVWHEVLNPHWGNYFYWLIGISLFFYLWELIAPWRKDQPKIRKDFWLDGFYMFFNFFLFSLVGYYAISNVLVNLFNDGLRAIGIENIVAIEVQSWPVWGQLLLMFVLRDFIHWNVHRLLHKVPWLWEFHKVHHSVEQMGFAAHLRFHWMETVVYRTIEYIPLAMIGFGIQEFLLVHLFALSIGHFNHSNIRVPLGPFKYIFNNPQMHIWHHAKTLPRRTGVNFGISLSIWDYLFGTHYIPQDGRDEPLGFEDVEKFPKTLKEQLIYGFKLKRK